MGFRWIHVRGSFLERRALLVERGPAAAGAFPSAPSMDRALLAANRHEHHGYTAFVSSRIVPHVLTHNFRVGEPVEIAADLVVQPASSSISFSSIPPPPTPFALSSFDPASAPATT